MATFEEQLDEIILKPARWQYDDYQKAKRRLIAAHEVDKQAAMAEIVTREQVIAGTKKVQRRQS